MQEIRKSLIILLILFSLATMCLAQPFDNSVRVAIIQDAVSLNIKVHGFCEIVDSATGKVLHRFKNLKTTVTGFKDGILLGGEVFNTGKLSIKADDIEALSINGRRFRGDIQVIKRDNSRLLIVNSINLEDYIKGILYHEVSHYWPHEALKAQAIVCRTYAAYQMQENKAKDFDVTSDVYSQVYGGAASERYRTNKAVEETKDMILMYQGKVFPAYFHATCGGHTEDASLLWNINIPPLKGVVCDFCKDSPHFKWQRVLSLEEIREKLNKGGRKIADIKGIGILGRDKSGRITKLKVSMLKEELMITGKDFRHAIGPDIIRSTNFNIDIADDTDAVFEGVGWGHGVGMCQWGAYFMAKDGRNLEQILKYYYPGSDVKTLRF